MPGLWDPIKSGSNMVIEPGPVKEHSTGEEQLDILHRIKAPQLSLHILGCADRFEMGADVQHRRQGPFTPRESTRVNQVSHAGNPTAYPFRDGSGVVALSQHDNEPCHHGFAVHREIQHRQVPNRAAAYQEFQSSDQ